MKLKKTENDHQKYIYYFEIVCFFKNFVFVDFIHLLEVCVFFLHGFRKNAGESNGFISTLFVKHKYKGFS